MTTPQGVVTGSCIIALSILAHAWMTQAPRYSMSASAAERLNVRTGEILLCRPSDEKYPPTSLACSR